jgi:hypothetical protein
MGLVHPGNDAPTVTTLSFVDLVERYQPPLTVVLAHCRDFTPSTLAQRLDEASGWL